MLVYRRVSEAVLLNLMKGANLKLDQSHPLQQKLLSSLRKSKRKRKHQKQKRHTSTATSADKNLARSSRPRRSSTPLTTTMTLLRDSSIVGKRAAPKASRSRRSSTPLTTTTTTTQDIVVLLANVMTTITTREKLSISLVLLANVLYRKYVDQGDRRHL
jgi:hypothetical protein